MDRNTLLIIEDSSIQSKIICQRFESMTRFTLLAAHSMAEATQLAEANRDSIFAAVVDLNLPDAPNGETVDVCLGMDIPCVVLAASFDEALRKRFLEKKSWTIFSRAVLTTWNRLSPAWSACTATMTSRR